MLVRISHRVASSSIRAQLKQAAYLLLLLLMFKARRLPITLATLALLPSNFWLLEAYSKIASGPSQASNETRQLIDAETFSSTWEALADSSSSPQATRNLRELMTNRGASKDLNWLRLCDGPDNCRLEYFRQLRVESKNILFGHLNFNLSDLKLECLHMPDTDLVCAFLYQLMVQSMASGNASSANSVFKDVQFAQYVGADDSLEDMLIANVMSESLSDTVCSRTIVHGNNVHALWMTILLHILLTTAGCMVHFTATTAAFISGLKENGFLQLMFGNGLSVSMYWSVILCVTVLETALFASIFALSYGLQCPDFYPKGAAINLLFIYWVFCYSQAAICLLATVLFQSYFIGVVAMVAETLFIVVMSVIGVLRLVKIEEDWDNVLLSMLMFPPGHIVQYSMYILLPKQLKQWTDANKDYLHRALLAMQMFPFALTLLMIYLDFVLTNGNGLLLPPQFLFSPSFWLPRKAKVTLRTEAEAAAEAEAKSDSASSEVKAESEAEAKSDSASSKAKAESEAEAEASRDPNIERVVNGQPAIVIRDISVRYGRPYCTCSGSKFTQALNSISCTIYQNQITALIGHNGAGKTTLIRVLTGEETPTNGLAVIDGVTVTDPYERLTLRRRVSICKQVDVLSPHLTVAESIRLAVLSKGLTMASQQEGIDHMMNQLGLSDKGNVRAMDLSGGQLRKVCCIIALLGDPPVVMLDEPTSGLDPVSRRRLWQLLQDRKLGRCIILCTQFMDEADILADRKLFLSSGRLICAGSSLFLKHLFDCSTTINVSLKSDEDLSRLMNAVPPDVQLVSQIKTELQLRVKSSSSALHVLADAVQTLEESPTLLSAFGVSQANLDDIFMRLENVDAENLKSAMTSRRLSTLVINEEVIPLRHPSLYGGLEQLTGVPQPSVCKTFASLMAMNLRRQVRAPIHFLCRFLMPIALIIGIGLLVQLEKTQYNLRKDISKLLALGGGSLNMNKKNGLYQLLPSDVVRTPAIPSNHVSRAICLSDEGSPPVIDNFTCAAITGAVNTVAILMKPRSVSLDEFLRTNTSASSQLRQICQFRCSFVYSTSWDAGHPNWNRSIVMGQYGKNSYSSPGKASYNLVNGVLQHFRVYDLNQRVRLSTIVTFEWFKCDRTEVMVLLILYSIIPVTFMTDPIEDKTSRVRQQMYVMGLSSKAYWVNTFVIHWTQYILYVFVTMLVSLQWHKYRSILLFCAVGIPILSVGTVSNLLTVYCIGSLQRTANYSDIAGYFFFVIIMCILPTVITSRIISALCIWFIPPMAPVMLTMSAMKIFTYGLLYFDRDRIGDVPDMLTAYLEYSDTRHALAAMPVHIVLQLVFMYVSENWDQLPQPLQQLQQLLGLRSQPSRTEPEQVDGADSQFEKGVIQERDRVELNPRNVSNVLEVRRLEKIHPNGVKAVRGVTFGAGPGEIFGLLGQNGAGKTTIMSVIVGEVAATGGAVEVRRGDAWIEAVDSARLGAIGYCPQHNPLFDNITVEEHLYFYAQIRGLPSQTAQVQVDSLIECLGLSPHRGKAAKHLSGGNKRRLCLAMALLGEPSVVIIDEASTGVDPENKRAIWSAIRGMTGDGRRSVIVTTHSMEEVEALCSRVGIMNRGVMIGFGTVQQLRSRHGEAYILEALFRSSQNDLDTLTERKQALKAEVQNKFPDSLVLDDICASVHFQVPIKSVPKLSVGIRWLAENQSRLGVKYFSLHQMSLDQVFVNMMRQHDLEIGEVEMSVRNGQ